jgi:hypothetical protein
MIRLFIQIIRHVYLLVFIALCGIELCAQKNEPIDSIIINGEFVQEYKNEALFESPLFLAKLPQRDEITRRIDWSWEFLGPDAIPKENNPGGRAIPAYSVNRGNGTGRINYLLVHPNNKDKVWACSPTGGLWFTNNGGAKWLEGGTDQLPVSGVSSVAVNLKKPKQWIVSTGDGDDRFMFTNGLWRTYNEGKTYECINGTESSTALPFGSANDINTYISEVACSPTNFNQLLVASTKGLWYCENARRKVIKKWKRISDGQFYDIEFIPQKKNGSQIIVAAGDKLVISYDNGKSWNEMQLPEYENPERFLFLRMSVEYCPEDPDLIYVAVTSSEAATSSPEGEATLQTFSLKDRQWKIIRSLKPDMSNMLTTRARAFDVCPTDKDLIMCANVQPIYRSTDGGISFSKTEKNQMHDDCHVIEFSSDGKEVWCAHDGGVSISYDGGIHWSNRDNGIGAANIFGLSTSQTKLPQVVYGGYDVGGNMLRQGEWKHVSWGDGFETICHPLDSNVMFSSMQNGMIQRCVDGDKFDETSNPSVKTQWHTWMRMHPTRHNTIYCAGARLVRSNDLGKKWETIFDCKKMDAALHNAYRFYLSEDHPEVMYVYVLDEDTKVNPQVWRTFNLLAENANDIVWEKLKDLPIQGWIMNICIDPENAEKCWILYNSTEPKGKLWWFDGVDYNDVTLNLGLSKCESMIMQRGNSRRLYIGSNYGVFSKKNTDSEWTLMMGLPGTFIKSLDINYATGKLVVGTFGRGVWQGDLLGLEIK